LLSVKVIFNNFNHNNLKGTDLGLKKSLGKNKIKRKLYEVFDYEIIQKRVRSDEPTFQSCSNTSDLHSTTSGNCQNETVERPPDINKNISKKTTLSESQSVKGKKKAKNVKPKFTRLRSLMEVRENLNDLIMADEKLYDEVLCFKPIFLSRIRKLLNLHGFKCKSRLLCEYLDEQVGKALVLEKAFVFQDFSIGNFNKEFFLSILKKI